MTERKIVSRCCGANVEDDWFPGKKYHTVDDIKYTCSKCHKPCKVKEERNDHA